jgi:hypothetical protein
LPDDYIEFQMHVNGGTPSPNGFWLLSPSEVAQENRQTAEQLRANARITGDKSLTRLGELYENTVFPSLIQSFLPASSETTGVVDLELISSLPGISAENFEGSLIPIAECGGGLFLLMSCYSSSFGKIFWGLEGLAHLAMPPFVVDEGTSGLRCVADSFTGLIQALELPVIRPRNGFVLQRAILNEFGFSGYHIDEVTNKSSR